MHTLLSGAGRASISNVCRCVCSQRVHVCVRRLGVYNAVCGTSKRCLLHVCGDNCRSPGFICGAGHVRFVVRQHQQPAVLPLLTGTLMACSQSQKQFRCTLTSPSHKLYVSKHKGRSQGSLARLAHVDVSGEKQCLRMWLISGWVHVHLTNLHEQQACTGTLQHTSSTPFAAVPCLPVLDEACMTLTMGEAVTWRAPRHLQTLTAWVNLDLHYCDEARRSCKNFRLLYYCVDNLTDSGSFSRTPCSWKAVLARQVPRLRTACAARHPFVWVLLKHA